MPCDGTTALAKLLLNRFCRTTQNQTSADMKAIQNALRIGAVVAGLWSLSASALPVPVNITVNTSGNLLNGSGVANSTQYATLHGLSPSNNNPDRNLAFLNALISNWNGVNDPDLPLAVGPVALDVGSFSGNSYTAPLGYDYVVFHFGAGPAGGQQVSPGGWWQAWYLGGGGGTFSVPQVGGKNVGGFSSARFFNRQPSRVPDGGATLTLLGAALLGLVALQRKLA
jgi:hypothetical protein